MKPPYSVIVFGAQRLTNKTESHASYIVDGIATLLSLMACLIYIIHRIYTNARVYYGSSDRLVCLHTCYCRWIFFQYSNHLLCSRNEPIFLFPLWPNPNYDRVRSLNLASNADKKKQFQREQHYHFIDLARIFFSFQAKLNLIHFD